MSELIPKWIFYVISTETKNYITKRSGRTHKTRSAEVEEYGEKENKESAVRSRQITHTHIQKSDRSYY